jgi:F-box-like
MAAFNDIPNEVLCDILEKLDAVSLANAQLVCENWKDCFEASRVTETVRVPVDEIGNRTPGPKFLELLMKNCKYLEFTTKAENAEISDQLWKGLLNCAPKLETILVKNSNLPYPALLSTVIHGKRIGFKLTLENVYLSQVNASGDWSTTYGVQIDEAQLKFNSDFVESQKYGMVWDVIHQKFPYYRMSDFLYEVVCLVTSRRGPRSDYFLRKVSQLLKNQTDEEITSYEELAQVDITELKPAVRLELIMYMRKERRFR